MEERHQDPAAATRTHPPLRWNRCQPAPERSECRTNQPGRYRHNDSRTPAPTQIHGRYLQQHDSRPRVARYANSEHASDLRLRTSIRRTQECGTYLYAIRQRPAESRCVRATANGRPATSQSRHRRPATQLGATRLSSGSRRAHRGMRGNPCPSRSRSRTQKPWCAHSSSSTT